MDSPDRGRPSLDVTAGEASSGAGGGVATASGVVTASGAATATARARINSAAILEVGTVLGGRFEILEILGVGGMGAVYKAHDRDIGRIIALKCIRPELADHPEIIQRFKQELLLARQVAHRNIIRIFDVRESGGLKFITMEHVVGRDLRSILSERGKLPPSEALDIIQQVCAGLAAAHAEGVLHRDLKPSNIMLDQQGRVVVMDFGLARTLSGEGMTQTGAVLGTMEYMSPEQAKAEDLDARSDLYTVGLIFYELLTGKMPFQAASATASLLKRTQQAAIPAADIDPEVSRPVSAIVSKCLEREPSQRYQNFLELIAELDVVQGKRPVSTVIVAPPQATPWKRMSAVAVALVISAVAGTFWWTRSRPTAPETHKAVTVLLADFQNRTSDPVFDGTVESGFALAIEGASFINAYNREQARKIAAQLKPGAASLDEENARLVAVREGVNVVISGAVEKQGDGYKISCQAIDANTSQAIGSAETSVASKSAVLQAVGSLAGKMRGLLGDTTPESVKLAQEETFTSSSIEAAHDYAVAQGLRYAGKSDEAIQAFKKAIELDPSFGSAYGSLAAVYWNLGNQAEAIKSYKTAMQHIDRMTDREKYRTRGGYYLAVADGDKAVEEFSALVKQYPADSMGQSALAFAYYLRHDMVHAMEASRRAMEIYPKNVVYHNNEALYALFAGDLETAEREAEAVLQINPQYDKAIITIALTETARGNFEKAIAGWHKIGALGVTGASYEANGLADLALFRSDPVEAIAILQKGIAGDLSAKNNSGAAKKYVVLAEAQLMSGKQAEALRSIDHAVSMDKASVLFPAGRAYAMVGADAKALALAAALTQQVDPMPQAYGKLVEGDIQLNRGHANEALKLYHESEKISDTWLSRFELARGYLKAGAFTEANTELENCLKRRGETTDIYVDEQQTFRYFPPTQYYLGEALQGMRSAGAPEAYRNFLALKVKEAKDPMVEQARRRLIP